MRERNGTTAQKTTKTNTGDPTSTAAERNVNLSHNFHARIFGPGHGLDFWPLGTALTKPCPATFGRPTIAAMWKISFHLGNTDILHPNITKITNIPTDRRMHNSSFAHALYSSTHCHTGLALLDSFTFSHHQQQ